MSEDLMKLPGSSVFFKKICQMNISLRSNGQSIYWLKEDYWYSYDEAAIVVFENDLHEWYLKFHKEIEYEVPLNLFDNEKRQVYYQDLFNTTNKYFQFLSIVSEFINEIRPDQKLTIDYCKEYFSGDLKIIEEKEGLIIQDFWQVLYLSIDQNYDFVDLPKIKEKMSIHIKYLSLANSFLAEKLPKSILPKPQLKWLPKASVLGYLFLQLAKKGYIELPTRHGDPNFTEMGKIICSLFGIECTESVLKSFRPGERGFGIKNKALLDLPEATEFE